MTNRILPATLLAAPLTGLLAGLLLPQLSGGGAERLAIIEANSTRFLAANLLLLVSFTLFVPALVLIGQHLAEKGSRWGYVSAIAAAAGWILHLAIVGGGLVQYPMAAAADRAAMSEVSDAMFESASFLVLVVPMLLLTALGMLLTAVALWRARVAPLWASIAIVAAIVADFVAPEPFDVLSLYGLLTVGFAGVYAALVRRSREAMVEELIAEPQQSHRLSHPHDG